MYGGYIASGSAVYFSLSRAITRMAADIAIKRGTYSAQKLKSRFLRKLL